MRCLKSPGLNGYRDGLGSNDVCLCVMGPVSDTQQEDAKATGLRHCAEGNKT